MSYKAFEDVLYAIHAMKFGDEGAELIASWSKSGLFEGKTEEENFATKQGSVLLAIQRFSTGLSGPFPVNDFLNIRCLVWSFSLEDQTLEDSRFGNVAYTLIIIYFPVILEQEILARRLQLEHALLKLTISKRDVSEITSDFLKTVKAELHDAISQMEQVALLANTELVLNKTARLKWSFFATGGANYQELAKQLYLTFFEKIDNYQRITSQGIITASAIEGFNRRLLLEITVLSNYNAIETVKQACDSDSWKTGDTVFFLLPFSYSLENETTSILSVLDHCDEQTPLVVISEKVEELDSFIDPFSGSGRESLSYLKKQLVRETTAPLLILSGTIDQKILFKALKWSLEQTARKEDIQLIQFGR
ncbi:MAG: hypothetical protein ACFFD4_01420 [Candidatus Odinarchaeota archaeon]